MSSRILRGVTALGMVLSVSVLLGAVGDAAGSGRSAALAAHSSHGGPLSGDWSGQISRHSSYGAKQAITITVNARETAGTWRLSAACHGSLTLDSISNGYHHFRRHAAAGATCAGGDVDCLKRAGANLYDAITSHLGGSWDASATLKRVRTAT